MTETTPGGTADVTVVMPALNREDLIARALDSVAAQTVRPAQVIVVDDGSTDRTGEIARSRGATVLRNAAPSGCGIARNAAIDIATTTWIAFLDSDDTWDPDHLERLLAVAGDHVLVGAPGRYSDSGRPVGNPTGEAIAVDNVELLVPGDLVCISATMVRREALIAAGGFRKMPQAEDLDMWIRLLERGSGLVTGEPSATYFVHDTQMSNDIGRMRSEVLSLLDTYADRAWMTARVRTGAQARIRWDEYRRALATKSVGRAVSHAAWLLAHPAAWRPVLTLLARRRAGRRLAATGLTAPRVAVSP
jgi:glycosyltransferase involved in cell wall biosynthesis